MQAERKTLDQTGRFPVLNALPGFTLRYDRQGQGPLADGSFVFFSARDPLTRRDFKRIFPWLNAVA